MKAKRKQGYKITEGRGERRTRNGLDTQGEGARRRDVITLVGSGLTHSLTYALRSRDMLLFPCTSLRTPGVGALERRGAFEALPQRLRRLGASIDGDGVGAGEVSCPERAAQSGNGGVEWGIRMGGGKNYQTPLPQQMLVCARTRILRLGTCVKSPDRKRTTGYHACRGYAADPSTHRQLEDNDDEDESALAGAGAGPEHVHQEQPREQKGSGGREGKSEGGKASRKVGYEKKARD
ncbi:hypothetical protein PC9H_010242 [Pleurotus ostreatus]|uniref:Uncharacterized protein n=1 Tax=Pleurotus ostreatus TaxID=5322 RepID=A0A8H7DSV1_PLEOS|nr:uncharacterized protein PC9H_010242 [Pleurotus ostreatus]KAF7424931.1 hypothetical protein PC9H_010242 [Pleurotus ostreatus]